MTSQFPKSAVPPLVWILDDSPLEAALARRALTETCEVAVFSDGSELIERISSGTVPDVLVLDLHLPGMSGIEVCRFLRSRFDETVLPILMLTVYGHKGDLVEGLAAGANDYVTKPYDASELAARVATLSRVKLTFVRAKKLEEQREELRQREQVSRREIERLLESERVARKEAEAANRAKDEFLAMVSHELRTPLNAILGWTRLLLGGELPPPQRARALETVERNALAQTKLIEDLLDMTRIIGGKLTIHPEALDVPKLVALSLETVRPLAGAKQIALEAELDPAVTEVPGDQLRLQQVLQNLLTNAIKFTPDHGRVRVTTEFVGDEIEIAVADSGRGIEAAFVPHVFERFWQGEESTRRSRGGLGLGLAIVKHITELHGGSASAESEGPGRGATFRIRLPRSAVQGEALSGRLTPEGVVMRQPMRLSGLKVLLVDDDPDALELIAMIVGGEGADVLLASSGVEALELVRSGQPDLIVSDIGMPEVNGYELMRMLRELPAAAGGTTPAIALTAFGQPEDKARSLAAGFDLHFAKPVSPQQIVASVADLARR
jgi:signal transduction histidine kinase